MPAATHSSQEACKREIEGTANISQRMHSHRSREAARSPHPLLIFFLYEYFGVVKFWTGTVPYTPTVTVSLWP